MRRARMFWVIVLAGLQTTGCQKPYFMTELDYTYYNQVAEKGKADASRITSEPVLANHKPRTVRNPESSEQWKLSLSEAKRITLINNKQIAYLGYEPAEAGTQVDTQLAAFDTFFEIGNQWGRSDQQVQSNIQVLGTGQNAITQKTAGQPAGGYGTNTTNGGATTDFPSSLPGTNTIGFSKRNAAGGLTQINYAIDYTNVNPVNIFTAVNPAWFSRVNLSVQQPLLQGAGVEFNRSLTLIARSGQEQSIKSFEANVQQLFRDVELAYWTLYSDYQVLYSREIGLKRALATWQKEMNKYIVGTGSLPDVAQARGQFESFRSTRLQALNQVLNTENNLREIMGIAPDDGRQIVPADDPVTTEYEPNWELGLSEALDLRPELAAQRFAIRSAEIELFRQKNGLLPDLTVLAQYGLTGLDNEFDQSIDRLTDNIFSNWVLGARYRRQVGERAAHAAVRRAQLALSRQRAILRNQENTIIHDLAEVYRDLINNYELIRVLKDRRDAATIELEAREQFYEQGKATIDILLEAQNTFAQSLSDEAAGIARYNQSLAQWEYTKGSILINDNVALLEQRFNGTSPKILEERARQRSLPLPIHRGNKVHNDWWPCPDTSLPLYPPMAVESYEQPKDVSKEPPTSFAEPTDKPAPIPVLPGNQPAENPTAPAESSSPGNPSTSDPKVPELLPVPKKSLPGI